MQQQQEKIMTAM